MPWEHCGATVLDDVGCPVCGLTKVEWTVQLGALRVFRLNALPTLKLELLGEDGAHAATARYRVELADRTEEGELNLAGYVKVQGRAPGVCWVTFPGRDVLCVTDLELETGGPGRFACVTRGEKYVFREEPELEVEATLHDPDDLEVEPWLDDPELEVEVVVLEVGP